MEYGQEILIKLMVAGLIFGLLVAFAWFTFVDNPLAN